MQPIDTLERLSAALGHMDITGKSPADVMKMLRRLCGDTIKVTYEPGETPRRFILTSDKLRGITARTLDHQCNGVVVFAAPGATSGVPSMVILAVPAPVVHYIYKPSTIINSLHKYTITPASDGTVVTLYWYDDRWCMSSSHGYDVGHYTRFGETTFFDAFLQSAAVSAPEFSLDSLDKLMSYTVGFRHHDFHPLLTDPPAAWFVSCADLRQYRGLPPADDVNHPLPCTPAVTSRMNNSKLWSALSTKNRGAYSWYTTTTMMEHHYGYILRKPGGPDILMESTLMSRIRKLMYDVPNSITSNRMLYMTLRAYLGADRFDFISLFPQCSASYKVIRTMIDDLFEEITRVFKHQNVDAAAAELHPKSLAARVLPLLYTLSDTVNVMDTAGAGVIGDALMSMTMFDLYFDHMVGII